MCVVDAHSLWDSVKAAGDLSLRRLCDIGGSVVLGDLIHGSSLASPLDELRGCSALIRTTRQLAAALALLELDGVARRLVICPPDLPLEHLSIIAEAAEIDTIIFDQEFPENELAHVGRFVRCGSSLMPGVLARDPDRETEWVLLTSGTTGVPKMVQHSMTRLSGAIVTGGQALGSKAVWSTFYDIRRYGGLQILLRALLVGGSLVLSDAREATADFLARAAAAGVTHISGTPSHWRRALMSPAARLIAPRYVRLSGEIADQAILDRLGAAYPGAAVTHAFASTEAGVAFDIGDGLAGFPAHLIGPRDSGVEIKVEGGSLWIRSKFTAARYIGNADASLVRDDGFIDTGDMVEPRDGRYYFVGRRGGIINVGGLKVHPEEVEAVINLHPRVEASLVKARKSPITGAIVVAEVTVKPSLSDLEPDSAKTLKQEILAVCQRGLAPHKVPISITIVPTLDIAPSGKIARMNA
jgi:acyl-coenzyme A synthetase/AMP-(fatty) acid ligase